MDTKNRGKEEMKERIVDEQIRLIPYYPNDEESLKWYLDYDVVKQVDNSDALYDVNTLHNMYNYLSTHGDCYYIEYQGKLVGDVSLYDERLVAIVICKKYQNKHIGRRCIKEIINLAKEKGLSEVKAEIYSFNIQSQKMFESVGFKKISEELYQYEIK